MTYFGREATGILPFRSNPDSSQALFALPISAALYISEFFNRPNPSLDPNSIEQMRKP